MAKRARFYVSASAVVAIVAGVTTSAALGGAAHGATPAAQAGPAQLGVSGVQSAFGDHGVVTASQSGSNLAVTIATGDSAVTTRARFEAKVLALSLAESEQSSSPISTVTYADSAGADENGGPDAIHLSDAPTAALASDACQNATSQASASLTVTSARTLDLATGTCVFRLETADPTQLLADAPSELGAILSSIPDQMDHPYFLEVDDQSGNPVIMLAWIPQLGGQIGQGFGWLQPGLRSPAILSSEPATALG